MEKAEHKNNFNEVSTQIDIVEKFRTSQKEDLLKYYPELVGRGDEQPEEENIKKTIALPQNIYTYPIV